MKILRPSDMPNKSVHASRQSYDNKYTNDRILVNVTTMNDWKSTIIGTYLILGLVVVGSNSFFIYRLYFTHSLTKDLIFAWTFLIVTRENSSDKNRR